MVTRLPIDARSPSNFWDEQHKALASQQIVWVICADELLRAFELLARQAEEDVRLPRERTTPSPPGVSGTAMMLGGLAIENLLKAIRLPQVTALFDSRGAFALDTHKLLQLAESASIALTHDEQILLERLEQFIAWAGRYPVPLFCNEMRPRTMPNGGFGPLTCHTIPHDFAAITTFAEKLKGMLPTISYESPET